MQAPPRYQSLFDAYSSREAFHPKKTRFPKNARTHPRDAAIEPSQRPILARMNLPLQANISAEQTFRKCPKSVHRAIPIRNQ